jgi:hypothetical protein
MGALLLMLRTILMLIILVFLLLELCIYIPEFVAIDAGFRQP